MFTIIGGDGKHYGPVGLEQVNRWIEEGRANLQTLARRDGEADWKPLGQMEDFAPPATGLPPPLEAAPAVEVAPAAESAPVPESAAIAPAAPQAGAPAAPQPDAPAGKPLASRLSRLGAALLDNVFGFLALVPAIITFVVLMIGVQGKIDQIGVAGWLILAGIGIFFLLVLAVIQIWMLCTRGQTLGKRVVGIRIVRFSDDSQAGFVNAFLLRSFVVGMISTVLGIIPFLGAFLQLAFQMTDICFIFRDDRRCLHDLIADTKVVEA